MLPGIDWPLARNLIRRGSIRHTFGNVRRNADGSLRPHQGWDFEAAIGTPIHAIADGHVVMVRDQGDYGKQVVLAFDVDFDGDGRKDRLFAVYAHLSAIDVEPRQAVARGKLLGLTGDSGNARGMPLADQHLHFEIRTQPVAGRGLSGRLTPLVVFGVCPLREAAYRQKLA